MEARKTEIAMGINCIKMAWKEWEIELETVNREHSKKKVRGRKPIEKEITVNSPLTTVMLRK